MSVVPAKKDLHKIIRANINQSVHRNLTGPRWLTVKNNNITMISNKTKL